MQEPFIPPNEKERLQTLRELLILDTASEHRFDVLTQYASEMFEVEIALVSLIDENRQWFKSNRGLNATETPRNISFCGHAILEDEPMVVPDATADPRFHDNPLVTGEPKIRFYAGAPLVMDNGMHIGTLCLIGHKPRQLSAWEIKHLKDVAKVVSNEIQGRNSSAEFMQTADTNRLMKK